MLYHPYIRRPFTDLSVGTYLHSMKYCVSCYCFNSAALPVLFDMVVGASYMMRSVGDVPLPPAFPPPVIKVHYRHTNHMNYCSCSLV